VLRLDQVERVPLDDGDWLSLRRPLAVTAFGINAYTARDADSPLIERHDERSSGAGAHQEVYLVQQGHAVFTVDDEEVDAPAGTLVAIDPDCSSRRLTRRRRLFGQVRALACSFIRCPPWTGGFRHPQPPRRPG